MDNNIPIIRNIFVFLLGFLMCNIVIIIRSENVMIPIRLLLIPRVFLYSEFWTTEQDEVCAPQRDSTGVKARMIENIRDIVKRIRRILYFILA